MLSLQSGSRSSRVWLSICVVFMINFQSRHFFATFVFHFLVILYIPDIVNLPLNKPSQAMTNSHGEQGWGWVGRHDWFSVRLACSSVRLLWQQGLCIRSECGVFRARDYRITGNMTWHSFWTRPLSPPFRRSLHQFHLSRDILSCRVAPPHSLQPEWHYHHN